MARCALAAAFVLYSTSAAPSIAQAPASRTAATPTIPMTPFPSPAPTPQGPLFSNGPAVRFVLEAHPLGIDPDGNARLLAIARFYNANGAPTLLLANDAIDWRSRDGFVQWQTRMRYGQPAAIVSATHGGTIGLSANVRVPALGTRTVTSDVASWRAPHVVARALGPHLVQIGWFPQTRGVVRIARIERGGARATIGTIAGPGSTFRDALVRPGATYRYVVSREGYAPVVIGPLATPAEPPKTFLADASAVGMWLFFTTNPRDAIYYAHYDPRAVVAQAVAAHLRYVELRTAYGAFWEITPQAKPTIDAIVDGLADHGIATIGWTVPRDESFEDLAQSVRTAGYRTARGTPLRGVALDLERGDDFMGDVPDQYDALWHYASRLRAALGPSYLIISTVEDPYLEHLTQADYPYEQIARVSSALQPMSYWRMMRRRPTTPDDARVLLTASYAKLARESRRRLPISIGGQTSGEGRNGPPSPDEIVASLQASKAAGAIGECFFAWDGTQSDQWLALAHARW